MLCLLTAQTSRSYAECSGIPGIDFSNSQWLWHPPNEGLTSLLDTKPVVKQQVVILTSKFLFKIHKKTQSTKLMRFYQLEKIKSW